MLVSPSFRRQYRYCNSPEVLPRSTLDFQILFSGPFLTPTLPLSHEPLYCLFRPDSPSSLTSTILRIVFFSLFCISVSSPSLDCSISVPFQLYRILQILLRTSYFHTPLTKENKSQQPFSNPVSSLMSIPPKSLLS